MHLSLVDGIAALIQFICAYGKEMVLKENKRIRLLKYLEIFREVKVKIKKRENDEAQTHSFTATMGIVEERESAREQNELKFCSIVWLVVLLLLLLGI